MHEAANLKRDNIIKHVRQRSKAAEGAVPAGYDEALAMFDEYILRHKKKRTPERLFILKKIYECQAPVDIQTLFGMVCNEEGLVSLATMYNNLSLLVDAGLVHKIDLLGGSMAFYEKSIGLKPHGFILCDKCGAIKVLDDADFPEPPHRLPKGFHVNDVTYHIHGVCHKCQMAERRRIPQGSKATKGAGRTVKQRENNRIEE